LAILYAIQRGFHFNETKTHSSKSLSSEFMEFGHGLVKGAILFERLAMKEWLFLGGHFLAH
jgi:hypothetical protein